MPPTSLTPPLTLLQRLDLTLRCMTPFVITLLLALMPMLPLHLPHETDLVPAFTLMAVFYWTVYRPDLMPASAVFAIGIIQDFAAKSGANTRKISDEEILERTIYPMINEGAKILEEGKAIRPSDIDVVWENGYGWPVYRGGPMWFGDHVGHGTCAPFIEPQTTARFVGRKGRGTRPSPR